MINKEASVFTVGNNKLFVSHLPEQLERSNPHESQLFKLLALVNFTKYEYNETFKELYITFSTNGRVANIIQEFTSIWFTNHADEHVEFIHVQYNGDELHHAIDITGSLVGYQPMWIDVNNNLVSMTLSFKAIIKKLSKSSFLAKDFMYEDMKLSPHEYIKVKRNKINETLELIRKSNIIKLINDRMPDYVRLEYPNSRLSNITPNIFAFIDNGKMHARTDINMEDFNNAYEVMKDQSDKYIANRLYVILNIADVIRIADQYMEDYRIRKEVIKAGRASLYSILIPKSLQQDKDNSVAFRRIIESSFIGIDNINETELKLRFKGSEDDITTITKMVKPWIMDDAHAKANFLYVQTDTSGDIDSISLIETAAPLYVENHFGYQGGFLNVNIIKTSCTLVFKDVRIHHLDDNDFITNLSKYIAETDTQCN
ncbi:hypothetical protein D1872_37220 [compost metagenome]